MNDIYFCHPHIADRPIHFYFDDDANIGTHKLVFDVTDPASLHDIAGDVLLWRWPLLPVRQLCQMIQQIESALIGRIGIFDSNFERIDACGRRNLVEEAFIGESVLHPPWRPDPGGAQRCRLEAMANGFNIGTFEPDCEIAAEPTW